MGALIADYGLIGDGETCALVSRAGSIDFLCWPRFDSDTCFAALLGDDSNGRWLISPDVVYPKINRRYDGDTLVLQTEFEDTGRSVRITDFMPIRGRISSVIRIVEGLAGTMLMRFALSLRFDYGTMRPFARICDRGLVAELGPARIVLDSPIPMVLHDDTAHAVFEVAEGQTIAFVLSYADPTEDMPPVLDAGNSLHTTRRYWVDWIARFDKPCIHPEAVKRSLITLKALIHQRTGGLLAAATFGLPEVPGGSLNWDYRYTWLRDATFTLAALLNAGFKEEATAWRDWITRAIGGDPTKLQIVYRLDGSRDMQEHEAPQFAGYGGATPVLIGNKAAGQLQLDVYGELLNAMHVAARGGIERSKRSFDAERLLVEHLDRTWNQPGADIWETRGDPQCYTYSQAMAWVGIDQFLRSDQGRDTLDATMMKRLAITRDTIHQTVCTKGYSETLGHFVQAYGNTALDASLLILPLVGFLPVEDPRIAGTIAAIERNLLEGGFVRRKVAAGDEHEEGAFLACSCWLADCYYLQGRHDEARALLDRVIDVANDVGLLSEEYHVPTHRLIGNMPQALSHLAVVNSALLQSGPVLQRGV